MQSGDTSNIQKENETANPTRKDLFDVLTDILERLTRVETKIEDVEKRMDDLKEEITRSKDYMKYLIIILSLILSFVAAMFGMGWRPPS